MEEKNTPKRSLQQHTTKRFHASQIVVVVLLIISSGIAVGIALPQGWRATQEKKDDTETGSLLKALSESSKESTETLSRMREVIGEFRSIPNEGADQVVAEPRETNIHSEPRETSTYINYDWGVSFTLPENWTYSREAEAFVASDRTLSVTRLSVTQDEVIIPEEWQYEEETVYGKAYIEETGDGVLHHYLVTQDASTFIFTSSNDTLTPKEHEIITSLQPL